MDELVSAQWLKDNLGLKNGIILDGTLSTNISGIESTNEQTISGARYFDLKETFSDKKSSFPNTIPSADQFEIGCRKLGINQNSQIVIFDKMGVYSSPRVWWMFKAMGHKNVSVLNGGLPAWEEKGFETSRQTTLTFEPGNFKASFQKEYVISYDQLLGNLSSRSFQIIDARSEGRFNGTAPEPRKHLKSGNIQNSINIPYEKVLKNGKFKDVSELKELFAANTNEADQLVFSCGSGLTACIIMLASEIAFKKSPHVYDGSWTEWAELQKLTID
jgi:thiosulfate/3-mercaptopyruvate sulfurtransferase